MDPLKNGERRTRQWLAIGIVIASLLAVSVLAGIAISRDGTSADDVPGQVLPLFGTWVGAVIAFYFTKDSLESAARTTQDLMTLDRRLKSVKVTEAMIPVDAIEGPKQVGKAKDLEGLKVADVLLEMKRNRMPVVDAKGVLLLVIHKSTLTEFLATRALAEEDPASLTFKGKPNEPVLGWITNAEIAARSQA